MPISITDKLPRRGIAHLPTPIDPLPHLSKRPGFPNLSIKRDDQTGLATGGNKTRKLEFLIAAALEAGADSVITAGSTQSNHARQTAAAAAHAGLEAHLVLYMPRDQPPQTLNGNLLISDLMGAMLHFTKEHAPYTKTLDDVKVRLEEEGKNPFVIPYGGSNPIGLMGYVVAMEEFASQTSDDPFDVIVFATSSGGTQAGMLLGAKIAGLLQQTRILGISVDEEVETLKDRVVSLAHAGAELLKIDWDKDDIRAHTEVNADYLGGGYAVINDLEREAVRMLASQEGILIDPVYTGRAFGGMLDLIRQGKITPDQRVLFWHTGGAAALFAFAEKLGDTNL